MKKLSILFLLITVIMTGCASNKEIHQINDTDKQPIEGYWMAENGQTLSFDSQGQAIYDGKTMDYSLYGQDNLSISLWGTACEYRYTLEKDVLTLTDLKNNTISVYYRDAQKQSEIQNKIKEAQEQQQRQQIMQEQKRQRQEQKQELENKVIEIERQINEVSKQIDSHNNYILTCQKEIDEATQKLSELENELYQLQNNPEAFADKAPDYVWSQIGYVQQCIENSKRTIDGGKQRLESLNDEYNTTRIAQYEEKIKQLELEKQAITQQIKELN